MIAVKESEFKTLYNGLESKEDIAAFQAQGYDIRLLETIFTQKTVRHVRKKGYLLKKNGQKMYNQWHAGKSFLKIAEDIGFPPMLVAMEIFMVNGTPRKTYWEYVRDPSKLYSAETAAELEEAREADIVYSPEGDARSRERGEWGEGLLWEWLDQQNVSYTTESDRKNEGQKTPDCLLDYPMVLQGRKIYWIESKASFGDKVEFEYNCRHQLIPYTELFGPGAVVYWTGHLDGLKEPKDIYLYDIGIRDLKLKKA